MKQKLPEPYYRTRDGGQIIYCGDSSRLLPLLEPASINLVLTDPPYVITGGSTTFGGGRRYLTMIKEEGLENGFDISILKRFDNWFVFCSKEQIVDLIQLANIANWMLLVWCKNNPIPLISNSYLPDCEYIVHKYLPERLFGEYKDKSRFYIGNTGKSDFEHPTVKPISIVKKLLRLGSLPQETILDPFLGSGTTLVACKALNHKGIGIEIEEKYCEIAAKRLDAIHYADTHEGYKKEGLFF